MSLFEATQQQENLFQHVTCANVLGLKKIEMYGSQASKGISMFSRMGRQATINVRRFYKAETQLESWIKINDRMHIEAASKAEAAVSGVKADVAVLRTEVGLLKNDIIQVKTDMAAFRSEVKIEVNELRKGQVEIHKEISKLHNQSSIQTRLLLTGGGVIASAFFGANQYVEYTKSKSASQPAVE